MSKEHWQIYHHEPGRRPAPREGDAKTFRVEDAPEIVVKTAAKAASSDRQRFLRGGFETDQQGVVVIEVNDNPNIDHGVEDVGAQGRSLPQDHRRFRLAAGSQTRQISIRNQLADFPQTTGPPLTA
jgi:hypothetical protein